MSGFAVQPLTSPISIIKLISMHKILFIVVFFSFLGAAANAFRNGFRPA